MDEAAQERAQPGGDRLVRASEAYEGRPGDIARARETARAFMKEVQSDHGFPVSDRAMDIVQLVVSELLTNACKYAPGPCLLDLELVGGRVEVTVWDSAPVLPVARAADPGRVGQHGLEIVMAVSQSFEVHRAPVGKRTVAAVVLADDPDGDVTGHRP
ncbi:ATP-binding protein [Streptomyces sp. NPDC086783]|uniref:ATP-binding protein n=1 Tax=Streptomyces sp. NPDC086783 TaxID=3365758 RepID=UPI00380C9068